MGFDCYTRYNDNLQFDFLGHSESREFDIPIDSEGYYDIRITVDYGDGKEKTSELLTMYLTDGKYEFIIQDSDADGIEDGIEIWDYNTDPFQADTDGDGFQDGFEVYVLESNPLEETENRDSDGDGLSDLEEQEKGTNPYLPDSDFDGLTDGVDAEPLVTDTKSGRFVDYSIKLNQHNDKKFQFAIADGTEYEVLYNPTTKNVKYIRIGENKEVWMFANASNQLAVMVNRFDDELTADVYSYQYGYVQSICHGGIIWEYEYDKAGNLLQTKIGGRSISSNEYENGILRKTVYGNGQENEYLYTDASESMEAVRINGVLSYQNQYDEIGNVIRQYDYANGITYDIGYNSYGSVASISTNHGFQILYNNENGTNRTVYQLDGSGTKEKAVSETDEGTCVTYSDGSVLQMEFDTDVQVRYQMESATGTEVAGYEVERKGNDIQVSYINGSEYLYQFGEDGRLRSISENEDILVSYEYDGKGQLIRSNSKQNGETILYHYDAQDNLVSAEHYAFTLGEPLQLLEIENYGYNDESWSDLLTEYNGQVISYDEIGNPLEYLGARLGWDNGRLLASFDKADTHAEYQYDSQGIRVGKTVNGIQTDYFADNKKIVAEKTGNQVIWYSYDSMDSPVNFEYQGITYYYQKNIYNDIVGIVDDEGNILVQYYYDEWGNVVHICGDEELALANKLRYRSYYYDDETDFYYLQSRYYDAQTGRFLNVDEKFVTFNLFAYCNNDPVNYVDHTGHVASTAISYTVIGILFATFALLIAYMLQEVFLSLWLDYLKPAMNTLLTEISNTIIYTGQQAQDIIDSVGRQLKEVQIYVQDKLKAHTVAPTYTSSTEVHHIVAQSAEAATLARTILAKKDVDIYIHAPVNLVTIKTGVHKHLHTNVYYNVVNVIIASVYKEGMEGNKSRVEGRLRKLRTFLLAISDAAPF